MNLGLTPSQTVGPFFAIGMTWERGRYAVDEGTPGAIWLRGRVTDGAGDPVPDAVVETWQPEPERFARCGTDAEGRYAILTTKPGAAGPDTAPHIAVSVFARGLLDRVVTRIYFADEPAANAGDAVLTSVPDDAGRATLIAASTEDGYAFDICLQGEGETVFFSI
jgi:protocatechuate 3,4-dioxygenase alpha subunit